MCSPTFCVPNLFPREAARSQPDSAKLSEIERACASGFRMTRRHAVHAAMPFLPVFAYHSCQYSPILASQLSPREMPPKSLHNRVKAPRHRARMCLRRSNAPFCQHCPYFIRQISPQETRPKSRPNSAKAPSNRARPDLRHSNACFCQSLPTLPMPNISSRDAAQKSAE